MLHTCRRTDSAAADDTTRLRREKIVNRCCGSTLAVPGERVQRAQALAHVRDRLPQRSRLSVLVSRHVDHYGVCFTAEIMSGLEAAAGTAFLIQHSLWLLMYVIALQRTSFLQSVAHSSGDPLGLL